MIGRRARDKIARERDQGFIFDLQHLDLRRAKVTGGYFAQSRLLGSQFAGAGLFRTNFNRAILMHVDFTLGFFSGCQFDAATNVTKTVLDRAHVQVVDFLISAVTSEQLAQMFGDGSVTLPANIIRPTHWPIETLRLDEFTSACLRQQNNPNDDPSSQPDTDATPAPCHPHRYVHYGIDSAVGAKANCAMRRMPNAECQILDGAPRRQQGGTRSFINQYFGRANNTAQPRVRPVS